MLIADKITVRYGAHTVVDDLSFDLQAGQWLMLVGPNGAGKSSLINALSQGLPYSGNFVLDGMDVRSYKRAQLSRKMGVLAQKNGAGYGYSVEEVVQLGRYAHRKPFSGRDEEGAQLVERALSLTGLTKLRHSSVLTLSGGEMQRTFLAQVFAQNPQLLILDEPANHLDLLYQRHIFSLVQQWLKQPGRAVLSVVHDLSLARRFGTHAILLDNGRCISQGETKDVLTPKLLEKVYQMDVYAWMQELLGQWEQE